MTDNGADDGGLQILGAVYGRTDVGEQLRDLAASGTVQVEVGGDVFADPWPDPRKALVVVFRFGPAGDPRVTIATEGKTLSIPAAADGGSPATPVARIGSLPMLDLYGATYGAEDVTARLADILAIWPQPTLTVSATLFGHQPDPATPSALVIVAGLGGDNAETDIIMDGASYRLQGGPPPPPPWA